MDFLKFSGEEDLGNWLSQVEQLSKFHYVELENSVIIAALIYHARIWFKIFSDEVRAF